MAYHAFKDEEGQEYGSFEVFHNDGETLKIGEGVEEDFAPEGFYWQACFPGCLPDGEPNGPFETEEEAIRDAQGEG